MTFWQVARRPRWILMLVFVLALAALFAWLGKWQIERAVIQGSHDGGASEQIVDLTSLTEPGMPVDETAAAHMVTVDAMLDTTSVMILAHRLNYGNDGYWVIGRLTVLVEGNPASLAAALGWTASEQEARSAVEALRDSLTVEAFLPTVGRYMPSQEPTVPDAGANPEALTMMSAAALANIWPDTAPEYFTGYLVLDSPPSGLDAIESVPPITDSTLNWLNVFYAIEWVVFAGFAVFLWYRLVKDARQRELDEESQRVRR